MQLGDIAKISTGLVLSRKKAQGDHDAKATYKLLTLKNISEDGIINNEPLDEFISDDVLEDHYFTIEGDVLIRLSHPYTSVFIDKKHRGLLVPSYFAIIKVDQMKYLPQYIAWYLNTSEVKKELERSQSGSRIPSTNQNILKTIPVAKTTMENQKAFIELLRLHLQEQHLYKKLIEEKERWFQGISNQLLQGRQ
ncbi:restriction endonuclease subunit S domain-containing protein [Lederbergia lenta]|uniref:Type I restriction modification system protein HsdIA n=1 Tax=Lederbergia lenta TaxID=1467 RepID=A0A2X4WL67_LEDLE|nr:restriction endonuclease subunit S [Lederbergia lenta]MEC2326212.1 restriction endonuclease subunit S [Lederbergia lenta]SQI63689.1 type I restriction modification system protein HsdIA [Lederbergia lenta]